MKSLPTAALIALALAYATIFVRLPTLGFGAPQTFDPFAARPRAVERLIVAKQFAQALPLAVELRRSFPNEPEIIYWVAIIQRSLNAGQAEASAWEDFVRAAAAPAVACPALPEAYARLGDAQRALASYERCLTFDPQDPDRMFDLALAYEHAGRISDATALYRQAAVLDPYNPILSARLASLSEGRR